MHTAHSPPQHRARTRTCFSARAVFPVAGSMAKTALSTPRSCEFAGAERRRDAKVGGTEGGEQRSALGPPGPTVAGATVASFARLRPDVVRGISSSNDANRPYPSQRGRKARLPNRSLIARWWLPKTIAMGKRSPLVVDKKRVGSPTLDKKGYLSPKL